ncbi:MAG TPA: hypothetical protein VK162_13535 [Streptosporangiaceae bacterium]|nr:hypothetical protein [Streptosporangiaceae bacterium]
MDQEDPEGHLRSLTAEALTRASPGRPLLPVSLSVQAVANAFVMLGLLPEPRAEEILAQHRLALESKGFDNVWGVTKGELTVRPGAHGYWDARVAGHEDLVRVPLSVAASRVHCPADMADVYIEWVTLSPAGLRLRVRAVARQQPPDRRFAHAISEVSAVDDAGHSYRLDFAGGWRADGIWDGDIDAEPRPAGNVAWLEFSPTDSAATGRVALPPPVSVPVGKAGPPWPTPAECYLAALAPITRYSINDAELGPEDTAEIVAAVADSLLAVGALPVTSALLRHHPGSGTRVWHGALMNRWGYRIHKRADRSGAPGRIGLAVRLPLEHATAVIEGISAHDDLVSIQLYGHPWVMGEYWPMITPCFQVRAIDDTGADHDGIPGSWRGSANNEGSGGFWFWPPVDPAMRRMRLIVSTPWEAAWADIELPGR